MALWVLFGVVVGFLHYEYRHFRIHFCTPATRSEEKMRMHHLAHHHRNPRAYHGVTTRLWDRVFKTLPARWREDYKRVRHRKPLRGSSNFSRVYRIPWRG